MVCKAINTLLLVAGLLLVGCSSRQTALDNILGPEMTRVGYLKHTIFYDIKTIRREYGLPGKLELVMETPMMIHAEARTIAVGTPVRVSPWYRKGRVTHIYGVVLHCQGYPPLYVLIRAKWENIDQVNAVLQTFWQSSPPTVPDDDSYRSRYIRTGMLAPGMSEQDVHLAWGPPLDRVVLRAKGETRLRYYKYHRQSVDVIVSHFTGVTAVEDVRPGRRNKVSRFYDPDKYPVPQEFRDRNM